ncbi:uncharacterized protein ACNS7B_007200 [Menidia menidia]|uniref:(Atlantic silverside) hypothetical protein n=1 Tax=Menidia menidia TaxID=238744 RepID=A0A8S4BF15_9TELE|nr:unnamed protein product [Menidia menidia]
MSEKHRALPTWMQKKTKDKAPLKSQRKRKSARVAFYCMNEAELVEAAVSCLTHHGREDAVLPVHQQGAAEEKAKHTTVKKEEPGRSKITAEPENLEEGDDLETTYVSETDSDITEMETLPYTERPGCEAGGPGAARDECGLKDTDVDTERKKGQLHTSGGVSTEEDDPLRLVREIFFS